MSAKEEEEEEEERGRIDNDNFTGIAPTFLMKTSFELQNNQTKKFHSFITSPLLF